MATTNNADSKVEAIDRRLFIGANTKMFAGLIAVNECATATGIDFSEPGIVQGALGYELIANDVSNNRVLGLKRYNKEGGSDLLLMAEGTNLRSWAGSGNWSAAIKGDFTTGLDMQMVVGGGLVLLSNGTDNVFSYDQSSVSDLGNTSTSPPKFTSGCFAYNRFFLSVGSFTYFSGVYATPASTPAFDRSAQVFGIDTQAGGNIVGTVDLGNYELIYLKESSLHSLYIKEADPADWELQYSFRDNGCVGKRAFVRVGNDVFYLSRQIRGITSIGKNQYNNTTGRTTALSNKIYKKDSGAYMDNVNWAYAHLSVAAHYDNKLMFVVPTGSSTTPNTMFIYHLQDDNSLNGWSVKENVPASCLEKYSVSGEELLYFGDATDGKVFQAFEGYTDNSTAITRTFESRMEDFSDTGNRYNKKIGDSIQLDFLTGDNNGQVLAYFRKDSGQYRLLGTVDTENTVVTFPVTFPVTFQDTGVKSFQFNDINQDGRWQNCQIKLVQTESGKTFQFLGYLITAKIQKYIKETEV